MLNVDTQAGNQSASENAQPTLFGWLDARDRKQWPAFLRGDNAHADERTTVETEKRQLPYLFELQQTPNVSRTIGRFAKQGDKAKWQKIERGWESLESTLRRDGWARERRGLVRVFGAGNESGVPSYKAVTNDFYEVRRCLRPF